MDGNSTVVALTGGMSSVTFTWRLTAPVGDRRLQLGTTDVWFAPRPANAGNCGVPVASEGLERVCLLYKGSRRNAYC